MRSMTNCINNCRGFVRGAVRELDGPNLWNVVMVGVKCVRQGRTKVGVHQERWKSDGPRHGDITSVVSEVDDEKHTHSAEAHKLITVWRKEKLCEVPKMVNKGIGGQNRRAS